MKLPFAAKFAPFGRITNPIFWSPELPIGFFRFHIMTSKLSNHLRGHRKRSALSQDEIAFLLGVESGAKICRYERFLHNPSLITTIALEVIFQKAVRELFPGLYRQVSERVVARVKVLAKKLKSANSTQLTTRKVRTLAIILENAESKDR